MTDADEITEWIRQTLQSCRYTLRPGATPVNQNAIEYFLFDNQKGYCQHFASAAVMMYRLYGIPARYVTGYAANPGDFHLKDENTYKVILTDQSAHAWVEIYDASAGWMPVDVTPSGSIQSPDREVTYSESTHTQQQESNLSPFNRPQQEQSPAPSIVLHDSPSSRLEAAAILYACAGALLAAAVVLALWLARALRIRRLHHMDCRQLFARIIGMLHGAGLLHGQTGDQPDFAANLLDALPQLAPGQVQQLLSAVSRQAFGNHPVQPEWADQALDCYRTIYALLIDQVPRFKRPLFVYRYGPGALTAQKQQAAPV